MLYPELINYITAARAQGKTDDEIQSILLGVGWKREVIDEHLQGEKSAQVSQDPEPLPSLSLGEAYPQKSSRKWRYVFGILALLVIGAGGGIAGYYFYRSETPEVVFEKMINASSGVTTFEYTLSLNGSYPNSTRKESSVVGGSSSLLLPPTFPFDSFSFFVKGKVDMADLEKFRYSAVTTLNFNAENEEPIIGELEMRVLDGVTYAAIQKAPKIDAVDLAFLEGKWVKFDPKEIEEQLGLKDLGKQFEENKDKANLSEKETIAIRESFRRHKVFQVSKEFPVEIVDDTQVYHYLVEVNKDELRAFALEVAPIINKRPLTESEIAESDEQLDSIESLEGEVWIGKRDYLPRKVIWKLDTSGETNTQDWGIGVVEIGFRNYNQPIAIEIPDKIVPLKTLLQEFLINLFSASLMQSLNEETLPIKP